MDLWFGHAYRHVYRQTDIHTHAAKNQHGSKDSNGGGAPWMA